MSARSLKLGNALRNLLLVCLLVVSCKSQDPMVAQFVNILTDHGERLTNIEALVKSFTTEIDTLKADMKNMQAENLNLNKHIQNLTTNLNSCNCNVDTTPLTTMLMTNTMVSGQFASTTPPMASASVFTWGTDSTVKSFPSIASIDPFGSSTTPGSTAATPFKTANSAVTTKATNIASSTPLTTLASTINTDPNLSTMASYSPSNPDFSSTMPSQGSTKPTTAPNPTKDTFSPTGMMTSGGSTMAPTASKTGLVITNTASNPSQMTTTASSNPSASSSTPSPKAPSTVQPTTNPPTTTTTLPTTTAEPAFDSCDDALSYDVDQAVARIRIGNTVKECPCLRDNDGSIWLVIQRRVKGDENFDRLWDDYKVGFGASNFSGDFWLGNENIYLLTDSADYTLKIEMEDWARNQKYAEYQHFRLLPETASYRLTVGSYSGTAGDSFHYRESYMLQHHMMPFSTKDRDNDNSDQNCARELTGGWWFNDCYSSNLNGKYLPSAYGQRMLGEISGQPTLDGTGVEWYPYKKHQYSMKHVEMKMSLSAGGRG